MADGYQDNLIIGSIMTTQYSSRYAIGPGEAEKYGTQELRDAFLVDNIFVEDTVQLSYTHYERFIVGGVYPVNDEVNLETIDPLKAEFFLSRRELGAINIGGDGLIIVDNQSYPVHQNEALYIGAGSKDVKFISNDKKNPAKFYLNSAPAHMNFPVQKFGLDSVEPLKLGSIETSNDRAIYQFIIGGNAQTCQLQMGMTVLNSGSVWNTMPAHQHDRRMEAYFYFGVPENEAVCHFMGRPEETRHIWVANEQAVVSPPWSIHCGSGTSNYTFIWGMAGENLDYSDMDKYSAADLR
jgi:4-deoxy-L-threo-5-hexosulose-uronate ketol-isomerase